MNPLSQPAPAAEADPTFRQFQRLIRDMYLEKDLARGVDGTFMWLMEEVGELAGALRNGTHDDRLGEFADVLAVVSGRPAVVHFYRRAERLKNLHLARERVVEF